MPQLTDPERNQIIGQLQVGTRIAVVARAFNISKRTVMRTIHTGSTKNRAKTGRPSKTTPAENRAIVIKHLRNRFQTAEKTKREFTKC